MKYVVGTFLLFKFHIFYRNDINWLSNDVVTLFVIGIKNEKYHV